MENESSCDDSGSLTERIAGDRVCTSMVFLPNECGGVWLGLMSPRRPVDKRSDIKVLGNKVIV